MSCDGTSAPASRRASSISSHISRIFRSEIGRFAHAFVNPDTTFEPSTIPNAQEANRHLFPNVTVSSDDGNKVRLESRASLPLPIHLTGVDTYGLFLVLSFSVFRGL